MHSGRAIRMHLELPCALRHLNFDPRVRQRQAKLLREVQVFAQLREGALTDGGIPCGEDLAHLMREAISMQSESASAAGHHIAIRYQSDSNQIAIR
jgi:hypothetical protein